MTDTPEVNDIPAILARVDAATDGPWTWALRRETSAAILCDLQSDGTGANVADAFFPNEVANAEFIAHSRTDVPNMAAEILSLRAQVAAAGKHEADFVRLCGEAIGLKGDDLEDAENWPDPNLLEKMASLLTSCRRQSLAQKRLDVLEELIASGGSIGATVKYVLVKSNGIDGRFFNSLTEAADAELLSRREKENG